VREGRPRRQSVHFHLSCSKPDLAVVFSGLGRPPLERCAREFKPMKPIRLRILIATLVCVGLMIGFHRFVSTGGFGLWTSMTLTCLFAAHLLAIPHNSGRYWTAFIVLGLFILAVTPLRMQLGFSDSQPANDQSLLLAIGIPLLHIMAGLLLVILSAHSSVCRFFDDLDAKQTELGKRNREAEQYVGE
jgi:hypothetical protein